MKQYKTFSEFYPYYLSEHQNTICRRLHFCASIWAIAVVAFTIYSKNAWWLLLAPVGSYGMAWVGHFFYEHNKPATFKYPLYSFIGDWVMFYHILIGKIKF